MVLKTLGQTLSNLILLAGLPALLFAVYQSRRNHLTPWEIAQRAGLQLGDSRYTAYCVVAAVIAVALLALLRPNLEPFAREGSALRSFAGLGLGTSAIVAAVLYGVFQTGFTEELLFRGLIAGALARWLPHVVANLLQAAIFLLPHALTVRFAPELAGVLPIVFAVGLFAGWARIESGSILGPWILHAGINVTMAVSVAARYAR